VYERLLAEIEAADLPGLGVVAGKIKAAQGERKINKAENEALRAAYAKRFSPTSAPAEASAMRQPGDEG
jgi:predicted metal-dependent phosphotriesterase family hydrolase